MLTLGIDLGSSSVKVSIFDTEDGSCLGAAFHPEEELPIMAQSPGYAEQHPDTWWECFQKAFRKVVAKNAIVTNEIEAIGISYQMHGLVAVDKDLKVVRPSIIWCDSRAVKIGEQAAQELGNDYCQNHLLNSPGNFTASKLKWVKDNEPERFKSIYKFMLPGDYLVMKLTGSLTTTSGGLSEGVLWDFKKEEVADQLMNRYGFSEDLIPDIVPTFTTAVKVNKESAEALGISPGTPITYRAGDQPNNAFSLNVTEPGEVAATAGTSGVIYGVTDQNISDDQSRINTFLHVNNQSKERRNGILLCINGSGILNSWIRKNVAAEGYSYQQINEAGSEIPIGSDGLRLYPFGNGAERIFNNRVLNSTVSQLDFNRHNRAHLYRAGQEGVAFAMKYGFDLFNHLGLSTKVIRAGKANMFLSPIFREAFVNAIGVPLELYDTDGAVGAARAAAYGKGCYNSLSEAFRQLQKLETIHPQQNLVNRYADAYDDWKLNLNNQLNNIDMN